jgi:hypothetical protein
MSKSWLAGIALVTVCAGVAPAANITTKKLSIKDAADTSKRQIQILSVDPGVLYSLAGDPATNGASVHVYSATDDECVIFPAGPSPLWKNTGTKWQFKSKTTKNAVQIKNAKLIVKLKTGVTYSLADNMTQGVVNALVQFGTGTQFCMRCTGNKKDNASKFIGTACVAAACDPEPSSCVPPIATTTTSTTTTSTTTTSSTTTTTLCTNVPTGTVVKGSLTATLGRFNYNLTLGLAGANAACNTNFPGSHACSLQDLQSAPTSDLACLKDTASMTVASFWAIDATAPALQQCNDDAVGGSGLNWEYATAHTASRGEKVSLDNGTGVLGSVTSSLQCNISGTAWVGCCQ